MTTRDRTDPPAGREIRGDLICTQCARSAGTVQGANVRLTRTVALHVQDPRHADAVRHLRCPDCSGRLWLQNSEEVPIDPLKFDREALRPYRGRPPKIPRLSPTREDRHDDGCRDAVTAVDNAREDGDGSASTG